MTAERRPSHVAGADDDLAFDLVIPAEPRRRVFESRHKVPEAARMLYRKNASPAFSIERNAAYWDMLRYKRTQFNRLQWDLGRESLHLCEDGSYYCERCKKIRGRGYL